MTKNIIDFIRAKAERTNRDDGSIQFRIDTQKKGPELNQLLDYLWSEIYIGKSLDEIYADDDGIIYCKTSAVPKQKFSYDTLSEHICFLIGYINTRTTTYVLQDLFEKYEEFLKDNDVERVLKMKETTSL